MEIHAGEETCWNAEQGTQNKERRTSSKKKQPLAYWRGCTVLARPTPGKHPLHRIVVSTPGTLLRSDFQVNHNLLVSCARRTSQRWHHRFDHSRSAGFCSAGASAVCLPRGKSRPPGPEKNIGSGSVHRLFPALTSKIRRFLSEPGVFPAESARFSVPLSPITHLV